MSATGYLALLCGAAGLVICAMGMQQWSRHEHRSLLIESLLDRSSHPANTAQTIVLHTRDVDTSLDRRAILKDLFALVTAGSQTQEEEVETWVRYLQDRIAHPDIHPMHEDGEAILDPIWILTNRLGQCGQTNRVLVDGLLAAGYEARVVQLNGHVAAEVRLNNKWLFLDADWLKGQMVRRPDRSIPSAYEIHLNPDLLLSVQAGPEISAYRGAFAVAPYYYVKASTLAQEKTSPWFGWESFTQTQDH